MTILRYGTIHGFTNNASEVPLFNENDSQVSAGRIEYILIEQWFPKFSLTEGSISNHQCK